MSADAMLSGAQFYHGSTARLSPGDILEPGKREARGTPDDEHQAHIFMTHRPDNAQFYADTAYREPHETPHVYKVEPMGPVAHGPMHDWNLGGEYLTPRAKVVGEEQHPYKWPGEADRSPVVHYERSALRALGTPAEADSPRRWAKRKEPDLEAGQ